MTATPPGGPNAETLSESEAQELLLNLRRKQGNWVAWGQACQALQKSGYTTQTIFEETGFEPIQQNQVIVAAQVYGALVTEAASAVVQAHFAQKGSDVLYELRILNQAERVAVATLALEQGLDLDEAREVAKAVKDLGRLSAIPEGFTTHPGDAMAYQAWKQTRQKSDFPERARLIAKGLRFAHSPSARKHIEQLLTDFSVVSTAKAPTLPVYRVDSDEELPRIIPVVGTLPLTQTNLQAVPALPTEGVFQIAQCVDAEAMVAVPGWQVIRVAEDPVALICDSDSLPTPLPGKAEDVLVVVDRAQREWRSDRYYIISASDHLQIQWFETEPEIAILGQVILILRPKKVLDEDYTKELWQLDE